MEKKLILLIIGMFIIPALMCCMSLGKQIYDDSINDFITIKLNNVIIFESVIVIGICSILFTIFLSEKEKTYNKRNRSSNKQ